MQESAPIPLTISTPLRSPSIGEATAKITTAVEAAALARGAQYRGAYVHVPFCRHKCHYCDFYSFVDTENRAQAYVERLEAELASAVPFLTQPIETVFVGGGTPTMLGASLLERMLISIRRILPIAEDAEWTVEANPETVDESIAAALANSGVRRVSLGAQSFNPKLLKALERDHDPASVGRAIRVLRAAGIAQLNLDLIFAVPGSTLAEWQADVGALLELSPDHVSAYGLVYEPNTPLAVKLRKGLVTRLAENDEALQYEYVAQALGSAGYDRYEISNWSRPGLACKHNVLYWENADWWAFGPSGASHGAGVRWRNVPRLATWLESGPSPHVDEVEKLDEDGRVGECFMLGLRLIDGMSMKRVDGLLGDGTASLRRRRVIATAVADGRLEQCAGQLRFTAHGLMVADSVLSALI